MSTLTLTLRDVGNGEVEVAMETDDNEGTTPEHKLSMLVATFKDMNNPANDVTTYQSLALH